MQLPPSKVENDGNMNFSRVAEVYLSNLVINCNDSCFLDTLVSLEKNGE